MVERTRFIEVVPYNPEWKEQFERIKHMIEGYIVDLIVGIEHVGSTSVEGLSAKPIIDIDVVMEDYSVLPAIVERLAQEGFEHQGNVGIEGREAFQRTFQDEFMKYHLYVCPKDGKGYLEHIAFRDYLRTHEDARREYEALKMKLAGQHPHDIDAYCDGKTECITAFLQKTIYR